jgi:hypothetical protein
MLLIEEMLKGFFFGLQHLALLLRFYDLMVASGTKLGTVP